MHKSVIAGVGLAALIFVPSLAHAQAGTTTGVATGVVAGALIGGPVGAAIGGVIGGTAGIAADATMQQPRGDVAVPAGTAAYGEGRVVRERSCMRHASGRVTCTDVVR